MADSRPPYPAHQSLYGRPQFHAAVQAAAPVSAGRQIAARLVDAVIAGVLVIILIAALIVVLVGLAVAAVFIWWLAARGNSIGNDMFGLRLVSTADGQPVGWAKALLWYAVVIIGAMLTGGILGLLFLFSPLFDTTSGWYRSWQDQMIGAVLIHQRMGHDTFARSVA